MSLLGTDPRNPDEFKSHAQTRRDAQQLMRSEMEQGLHKPAKLSEVLDEVIGVPSSDVEVTQEAWNIINEHGEGLVLGFAQWAIVQHLVEQGIISGRAGS